MTLTLKPQSTVETNLDIPRAVTTLGLAIDVPTLVLVGGASGMTQEQRQRIDTVMDRIASLAEELTITVVDGGTNVGIMQAAGEARAERNYQFPLVGVAVEDLVSQHPMKDHSLLQPNHSHFILTAGQNWGDESNLLAKTATYIAGKKASLTLLINGGKITAEDYQNSLAENREVIVLAGTGRLANELATQSDLHPLTTVIPLSDVTNLLATIRSKLTAP